MNPTLSHRKARRIPCLDGLRAVAIMGVLFSHSKETGGFPVWSGWTVFGDLGNLGVRCFFVISGFLITYLLLRELESEGRISLKDFYIRRAFRIFPAFYVFIASLVLFSAMGWVAVKSADLGYAATYSINFVEKKSWVVAHIWSLSVEEQFYLLWPLFLVVAGVNWARRLALGTILFVPILRIAVWYLFPQYQGIITKAFPTICDAIATGCLLACFREWLWTRAGYRNFLNSAWFVLVPTAVFISNSFASHTRPDFLVGQTVRNIGLALIIDWCLRNSQSWMGRCLNARWMVWVGALSYSLYLWQQIFMDRLSTASRCRFPINLMCALLCAALSYYVVERPFLKVRERLFAGQRNADRAGLNSGGSVVDKQRPDSAAIV